MTSATLVFPNQLFQASPALARERRVVLVEECLFFKQFNFHKQKLAYHRASMQLYAQWLERRGYEVTLLPCDDPLADARQLGAFCRQQAIAQVHYCDPVDDWLDRRLTSSLQKFNIQSRQHPTPMFLNSCQEIEQWYAARGRLHQTDFYIDQRKKLQLLVDAQGKPQGGKWSYDAENRQRYPKNQPPPPVTWPGPSTHVRQAAEYVEKRFASNYGSTQSQFRYPVSHDQALGWLDQFLEQRFAQFGIYEDAIVLKEPILHHSLLTPMLNVGLLTPTQIIHRTIDYAAAADIPLNSLEGFLRQLVGWREFIRGVYHLKGRLQRTTNFWQFTRKLPAHFWTGQTGIPPLDAVIGKVLQNAYCHHIERLMVLGNFMLLCEFDPDDVYRWFMELFIDAYDWVMVPNVYGMSQFADGGLMATKPYISGSNYLTKMSDAPKGSWQEIWDALFWRFMHVHRSFFAQNPRLGMLLKTFDRMSPQRQQELLQRAEAFLVSL